MVTEIVKPEVGDPGPLGRSPGGHRSAFFRKKSLPIDLSSMSDSDHKDKKYVISNGISDAKVPHTNPPQVFRSRDFFHPVWTRIVYESVNLPGETNTVSVFQGQECSFRSGLQFDATPERAGVDVRRPVS